MFMEIPKVGSSNIGGGKCVSRNGALNFTTSHIDGHSDIFKLIQFWIWNRSLINQWNTKLKPIIEIGKRFIWELASFCYKCGSIRFGIEVRFNYRTNLNTHRIPLTSIFTHFFVTHLLTFVFARIWRHQCDSMSKFGWAFIQCRTVYFFFSNHYSMITGCLCKVHGNFIILVVDMCLFQHLLRFSHEIFCISEEQNWHMLSAKWSMHLASSHQWKSGETPRVTLITHIIKE